MLILQFPDDTVYGFKYIFVPHVIIRLMAISLRVLVPSGPPLSVEVRDGLEYITVTWNPPNQSYRNGQIIGYVVSAHL